MQSWGPGRGAALPKAHRGEKKKQQQKPKNPTCVGRSRGSRCRGRSPGSSAGEGPGTGGTPGLPSDPAQRREPAPSCPTAGAGRDPTPRAPPTGGHRLSPGTLLAACPPPQARPRSAAPAVPVRGGGGDRGATSPSRRVPRRFPERPCPAVPRYRRRRSPAALAALASRLTFPCLRRPSPAPSDVTAMATNPRPPLAPPSNPARVRTRRRREGRGRAAPAANERARGAAWPRPPGVTHRAQNR